MLVRDKSEDGSAELRLRRRIRSFEKLRTLARGAEREEIEEEERRRKGEEMGDVKSLENATLESKREMDIAAALDEMREMKSWRQACSGERGCDAGSSAAME